MEMIPHLEARVRLFADTSGRPAKILAFAELTIGDAFVIKGIRILKRSEPGRDEPFIVFPAEKRSSSSDRWFDVAHPVTTEARTAARAVILDEYIRALGVKS